MGIDELSKDVILGKDTTVVGDIIYDSPMDTILI